MVRGRVRDPWVTERSEQRERSPRISDSFYLSPAQDSGTHVRAVEFFCHSRARVWRARGLPNSAGGRGEGPGFFARQARARMTEQEIEQDRNCHYDLQSSIGGPAYNQMLLLERVGRAMALMRRAREQTLALSAPEHYLEWFEPVQNAFFNLNLGATLEEFTRMLSPVTLEQLRYCGTMLSERFGEPELAKEEAAHVLRKIDG